MGNITRELSAIGKIIDSAYLIDEVRKAVSDIMQNKRAMVMGGEYAGEKVDDSENYDVVVVHKSGNKVNKMIARRVASLGDLEVDELSTVVDNVIGIRRSRKKASDK